MEKIFEFGFNWLWKIIQSSSLQIEKFHEEWFKHGDKANDDLIKLVRFSEKYELCGNYSMTDNLLIE